MTKVQVYDANGLSQEEITLKGGDEISKKQISELTFGLAVRVSRQNARQGTVGCKDRGAVSFSGRKPWKQKGTGRARAGTLRSPLWRKGGVTFGPQQRTRTLALNKKQRSRVFNNLFFSRAEENGLFCVDAFSNTSKPSTKSAVAMLKKLNVSREPVVVFVPWDDTLTQLSFRNIPSVRILSFDQPNVQDLSWAKHWVFLKRDVDLFNDMVVRWS